MSWEDLQTIFPEMVPSFLAKIQEEAAHVLDHPENVDPAEYDLIVPAYQNFWYGLLRFVEPRRVVETGLGNYACSSKFGMAALRKNIVKGEYLCCDTQYKDVEDAKKSISRRAGSDAFPNVFYAQPSTEALPNLATIGPWDVFLHDSDHEVFCQTYEYEFAWNFTRPGGWILSDDWTWAGHGAWVEFTQRHKVDFKRLGCCAVLQKPKDAPLAMDVEAVQAHCLQLAQKAEDAFKRWRL